MSNITLMHCYSDQNRGDAGIIEATVDLIKNSNPDATIDAISVFHEDDDRFRHEHYFTREVVNEIYPSLFYEPNIQRNGTPYSMVKKVGLFFKLLFVNLILLLIPNKKVAKILLTNQQYATFICLINTDVVISKGGSFLYSQKGINGEFFLTRMLFCFLLPLRLGKKVGVFSQSIGPFENKFSQRLLFYIFKKLDFIYLRETECLKYLPTRLQSKIKIIPDAAFYLDMAVTEFVLSDKPKVAITARPHKFSTDTEIQKVKYENYMHALKQMAIHCINKGYEIHLVGQVTGPSFGEDDRNALAILNNELAEYKSDVVFWSEEDKLLSPKELQCLYSTMNVVIGTRLHSTIFTLATNTPSINIAYHGTKSQGIMGGFGLIDFVLHINSITPEAGISMLNEVLSPNFNSGPLKAQLTLHRKALCLAMDDVLLECS